MTMNIGEALLHDPEDGKFHLFGQTSKLCGMSSFASILLRSENPSTYQLKRRCKTYFIQQGRMQQVGNGANLLTSLLDHRSVFREAFGRVRA